MTPRPAWPALWLTWTANRRTVRVFISSTLEELAAERAAARRAIAQLHLVPVWYESGAGRIRRAACTGLTWLKARFFGHLLADRTGLLCSSAACRSAVCSPARGPGRATARVGVSGVRGGRMLALTACQVRNYGSELPLQAMSAPCRGGSLMAGSRVGGS